MSFQGMLHYNRFEIKLELDFLRLLPFMRYSDGSGTPALFRLTGYLRPEEFRLLAERFLVFPLLRFLCFLAYSFAMPRISSVGS